MSQITYDRNTKYWRWSVRVILHGNARADISGETLTRAKARLALKSALEKFSS